MTPSATIARESRPRFCCSGVRGGLASAARVAICPSSVRCPVATTIASPRPQATPVPAKTIEDRSAIAVSSATGADAFGTGTDSPVNADSSSSSRSCEARRASAATRSPSRNTSRSPGTTSSAGTSRSRPSRITDGSWTDRRSQGQDGAFRARFLDEAEHGVEEHDRGDDERLETLADQERHRRRCDAAARPAGRPAAARRSRRTAACSAGKAGLLRPRRAGGGRRTPRDRDRHLYRSRVRGRRTSVECGGDAVRGR